MENFVNRKSDPKVYKILISTPTPVLQPAVEAFFHVHGLDNDVKSTRRRAGDTLDLLTESPAPLR